MKSNKLKCWLAAVVVAVICCPAALAQQSKIAVASFNRMETDITARVTAPKKDQNGEVCALIRIVTNVKDLMFEPDALGITARENKIGEIWLYVPRGARRISILHDQLGILRNYFYPDIIEKGTVYEMVLNTGDSEDKPVVENNMQFFVLRPEPANANVYVDDEQVPIENGLFSATMPKGEHTYRVEAPMYQPDAGIVTLGSEQVIKSVTLKPKLGYVEIFSLPDARQMPLPPVGNRPSARRLHRGRRYSDTDGTETQPHAAHGRRQTQRKEDIRYGTAYTKQF